MLSEEPDATQQAVFDAIIPATLLEGRDELNLAEFPIASLTKRPDPDVKTVIFQDAIFDKSVGKVVQRKLTVTGSDAYGLPTAKDDEVLVGLVQLSKLDGFSSQEVSFTRYQLLKILGWKKDGRTYDRLAESLVRWKGVMLHYKNAWRDRSDDSWKTVAFAVIDNVELPNSERRDANGQHLRCSFRWNNQLWESLKAGNIKPLDLGLYRKIENSIAKRMFRFLDKRFFLSPTYSRHLHEFAYEKIGLSRSYADNGQLKRALLPAIQILERIRFIEPLEERERFTRDGKTWHVHFQKVQGDQYLKAESQQSENSLLESRLTSFGVAERTAKRLVEESPEVVAKKLEELDYLLQKGGDAAPESPAGFLVASIKRAYAPPKGFEEQQKKLQERRKRAKTVDAKAVEEQRQKAERAAKDAADIRMAEDYLASLSDEDRRKIEETAREDAPLGRMSQSMFKKVVIGHVIRMMYSGELGPQQRLQM